MYMYLLFIVFITVRCCFYFRMHFQFAIQPFLSQHIATYRENIPFELCITISVFVFYCSVHVVDV